MSKIRFILVFIISQILCWFIAWLGGYNFDSRSFWVAYGAVSSIIVSGAAAFIIELVLGEDT